MPDLRKFIQGQKFSLAGSGMSSSETSLTLQSFKLPDGTTTITTTNIGLKAYGTLEPGTSREEHVSFTTITQNLNGTATLSGVTRGLRFVDPYDEVSANKKAHSGGSIFVISNTVAFYGDFANKSNDETVEGTWTFSSVPSSSAAPVSGTDLVNKSYADALTMNGTGVSQNRVVVAGVAGDTLAAGDLVYLINDNEWKKTDADTAASVQSVILGIAQGSGTLSTSISGGVLLSGVDATRSGLIAGSTYYASNTPGGISTTAGTNERAIGIAKLSTELYFDPYFFSTIIPATETAKGVVEEATDAEVTAGTATGATGAKLFITPAKLATRFISAATNPVVRAFSTTSGTFTVTIASPAVFTKVSHGLLTTEKVIFSTTGALPTGLVAGTTYFVITAGLTADAFQVSATLAGSAVNTSGAQSGTHTVKSLWTKPTGLKYVIVEVQAGGGAGASGTAGYSGGAGGAGGYSRKLIAVASLGATETVTVGAAEAGSSFGSHATATGGTGAVGLAPGVGGTGSGGDINSTGGDGGGGAGATPGNGGTAGRTAGGSSVLGKNYGGGASGGSSSSEGASGAGTTQRGIVVVTEYFI